MDPTATTEHWQFPARLTKIDASTENDSTVFQWQAGGLGLYDSQHGASDPHRTHEDNSELAADDCQSLCESSSTTDPTEIRTPIIPGSISEADFEEFQDGHGCGIATSSARNDSKVISPCLVRHIPDDPNRSGTVLIPLYPRDNAGEVLAESPCKANDPRCNSSRAVRASSGLEKESKSNESISLQTWLTSSNGNMLEYIFGLLLRYHSGSDLPSTPISAGARDAVGRCLLELTSYFDQVGDQHGTGSTAPSDARPASAESGMLSPSASSSHGHKRGFESEPRKSSSQRDDETPGGGDDDDDEEQGSADFNKAKKSRVEGLLKLSCPYRKRNPLRFNIRDSPQCSLQSYSLLANLKRHIKIFHRRNQHAYVCPRCKDAMPTKEALDQHQMLPASEMCEPRRVAPESLSEDGITPQVETILNDRKNTGKVDSWSTLWCVLFPEDKDGAGIIPLPEFIPPVELVELEYEIGKNISKLEEKHREAMKPVLCFPGINDEIREELVKTSVQGSRVFIDYILQYCREKYAAAEPGAKRPRSSRPISELSFQHPSSLRSPVQRHSAHEYLEPPTPRSRTASTGDSVSTLSGAALTPIPHVGASIRAEASTEGAASKPARRILPSAPGMKPQAVDLLPVVVATPYDQPSQLEPTTPTPTTSTSASARVAGFVSSDSHGQGSLLETKLHSLASAAAVVSGTDHTAIYRDQTPRQADPEEVRPEPDPSSNQNESGTL